jgi:hypothetical protein
MILTSNCGLPKCGDFFGHLVVATARLDRLLHHSAVIHIEQLYPGFGLFAVACLGMAWLLPQPRLVGSVGFDVHSLLYASLAVVVGFQSMMFWVFAKVYGMRERIVPPDPWFRSLMPVVTLEIGLIVGAALMLGGLGLAVYALGSWGVEGFGALAYAKTMQLVPSSTAILLGFQIIYSAFLLAFSRSAPHAPPKRRFQTVRPKQLSSTYRATPAGGRHRSCRSAMTLAKVVILTTCNKVLQVNMRTRHAAE